MLDSENHNRTQNENASSLPELIETGAGVGAAIKEDAISRIRQAIFKVSGHQREIVLSETQAARILMSLQPPDRPGALLHAYRAVEGYLDIVIDRPMLSIVLEPFRPITDVETLIPINVLSRPFIRRLRRQIIPALCASDSACAAILAQLADFQRFESIRDSVFHGFFDPPEHVVLSCIGIAESVTDLIDGQRLHAK